MEDLSLESSCTAADISCRMCSCWHPSNQAVRTRSASAFQGFTKGRGGGRGRLVVRVQQRGGGHLVPDQLQHTLAAPGALRDARVLCCHRWRRLGSRIQQHSSLCTPKSHSEGLHICKEDSQSHLHLCTPIKRSSMKLTQSTGRMGGGSCHQHLCQLAGLRLQGSTLRKV